MAWNQFIITKKHKKAKQLILFKNQLIHYNKYNKHLTFKKVKNINKGDFT